MIAFENLGWHRERIIGYDEDVDVIKRDNPDAMIIFGTGCFDESHSGHEIFFEQMRRVGEDIDEKKKIVVVIGLGRDSTLTTLKGAGRPVHPWWNRAYKLVASRDIDYVVSNDEKILEGKIDFAEVMEKLSPDVFVVNEDDSGYEYKAKLCKKLGVKIVRVVRMVPSFLTPTSSTELIGKMKRGESG